MASIDNTCQKMIQLKALLSDMEAKVAQNFSRLESKLNQLTATLEEKEEMDESSKNSSEEFDEKLTLFREVDEIVRLEAEKEEPQAIDLLS